MARALGVDPADDKAIAINSVEDRIKAYIGEIDGLTEARPTFTQLVGQLLADELFGMAGDVVRPAYGMLSAGTHGTKLGLDNLLPGRLGTGGTDPPGKHVEQWFEYLAYLSGVAYSVAAHHAFEYLGWGGQRWAESIARELTALTEAFNAAR